MVDTTTLLASSSFFWYGIVPSFKNLVVPFLELIEITGKKKIYRNFFKKLIKFKNFRDMSFLFLVGNKCDLKKVDFIIHNQPLVLESS